MNKILAASNNKNKLREIKQILRETDFEIISLKEAGISVDPEENGDTFKANALIKARAAAALSKTAVIADDSGLIVDRLGGEPGVFSKRYAGNDATDDDNNKFLVANLKKAGLTGSPARFVCSIAFIDSRGREYIFEDSCEGEVIVEPRGENGFGYDPYFYVNDYKKTMAQLTDEEKNSISHRGRALLKLKEFLKGNKQ